MSASGATEDLTLSAECTLAKLPGYTDMHLRCRQTEDVPLPHSRGLLLRSRCGCSCHGWTEGAS